jgi:hypothetical protein
MLNYGTMIEALVCTMDYVVSDEQIELWLRIYMSCCHNNHLFDGTFKFRLFEQGLQPTYYY